MFFVYHTEWATPEALRKHVDEMRWYRKPLKQAFASERDIELVLQQAGYKRRIRFEIEPEEAARDFQLISFWIRPGEQDNACYVWQGPDDEKGVA
jgi:hypothetical protein